jgi:hypothetical protein
MDVPIAAALTAAFGALGLFAGWRGARPPDPSKGPRLIPWRMIMVLAAAAFIALLFQTLGLLGVRPPPAP